MKVKLSAVIITYNEENNLERCLKSINSIVDEIVVVDSFSKDGTQKIAEKFNAVFIQNKFKGHIEQKNFAKSVASYNHIISLDADEALDIEAQKSVLQIKESWSREGYYLNRLNNYCGKWIKHGSWYPDYKLRIWDRRCGDWGGINPHDQFIIPKQNTTILKGHILHYTTNSKKEFRSQIRYFSNLSAKACFKKRIKSSYLKIFIRPIFRFIRDYIFKFGFLDGLAGYQICAATAYGTYLKYKNLKKLYE